MFHSFHRSFISAWRREVFLSFLVESGYLCLLSNLMPREGSMCKCTVKLCPGLIATGVALNISKNQDYNAHLPTVTYPMYTRDESYYFTLMTIRVSKLVWLNAEKPHLLRL